MLNKVTAWENTNLPTMATPSGCHSSAPAPIPNAIGSAPMIAQIVVIMIGRKRSRHAWRIAATGDRPSFRCASSASAKGSARNHPARRQPAAGANRAFLKEQMLTHFAQEVPQLKDPVYLPFGPKVSDALAWLANQGV